MFHVLFEVLAVPYMSPQHPKRRGEPSRDYQISLRPRTSDCCDSDTADTPRGHRTLHKAGCVYSHNV